MKPESVIVSYRTVKITVFPWRPRPGVTYWKFRNGKKTVVRSTLEKAKAEAKRIAEETCLGASKLGGLSISQTRAIRRMLEIDPTLQTVDEFLLWHSKDHPKKPCKEAVAEFLSVKRANAGRSAYNVETLTRHLSKLPDKDLSEIGPADLPILTGEPRTRSNRRAAWVTFFSWCRTMGYLPRGEDTAPEKLETPIAKRKVPATWDAEELKVLLANVAPDYLPWLALAAWAGLRTEEVCPDHKSVAAGKDGVRWSDILWKRDLIEIRPEVAKTGHRRMIPVQPVLRAVLTSLRPADASGRMGPTLPPHTPPKGGKAAETTRLGKLVGGWRRNALRHSFISYRSAQVGLAQAAMEAGNSEREAAKSYNDAKGKDEAEEWFSLDLIPQKYHSTPKFHVLPTNEKPVKSRKSFAEKR